MKKQALILWSVVAVIGCFYLFWGFDSKMSVLKHEEKDNKGIYILSTPQTVQYLSSTNYDDINEIRILGGSDMTSGGDGKVYIAVPGTPRKTGREIAVIKNGELIKKIKIKYSLPYIVKYNPYNSKLYVGHLSKISNQDENCITVIDTLTDQEETNIMYNYCVEDITFSKDNKMIVSALGIMGDDRKIEVIDLKNNSIIKTIPLDKWEITSMEMGVDNRIYAVTNRSKNPFLYVIDLQKGIITDKIKLKYDYPYRVYLNCTDGKEYIYITHLNIDTNEGNIITVVDPRKKTVVRELTNVNCPTDISFNNNEILVGDWANNRVYIMQQNGKLVDKLDIKRPISIVNVD